MTILIKTILLIRERGHPPLFGLGLDGSRFEWSLQPAAGVRGLENIALDRMVKVRLV